MNPDDTIVAVSSPPGPGVRGIVRISGPATADLVARLFRGDGRGATWTATAACWRAGQWLMRGAELSVSIGYFPAPRSYTGEDIAEVHCLGAPAILGMIVESCLAAGARRAEPGEFSARALLSGRMDFSQIHGVAGMIAARSDEQLRAAERLLHGSLGREALAAREDLADLLSLVEGAMDFADEPIEFIPGPDLIRRLRRIRDGLAATLAAGSRVQHWGELPRVVLCGLPNAGKSSLLNRLTGMDRAICTAIAGTTRDAISAPLRLPEGECLLTDIAGLDDAVSELDRRARAAAHGAIEGADLLLAVFDASLGLPRLDASPHRRCPTVAVANKCDLLGDDERSRLRAELSQTAAAGCLVSAATGEGCEDLVRRMGLALADRPAATMDSAIALMAEHRQALGRALDAIDRASALAAGATDVLAEADLVAAELHEAAEALGTLVGEEDTEAMLGRIFARFCVGK